MDNQMIVTFTNGEATYITAVGKFWAQGIEIKETITLICKHPRVLLPDREYEIDDYLVMLKNSGKWKFPYGTGYNWDVAFDDFLENVNKYIILHTDNQDEVIWYLNKYFALIEYKETNDE